MAISNNTDPELDWTFQTDAPETTLPVGEYTYRESRNSGSGSLGENPQATRIFLVDWEYLAEFTDDLLGYATAPETTGGTYVTLRRTIPEEHPDFSFFYATDVQFRPLGQPTATGTKSEWKAAEVTVTYKPLPYAVKEDDDITSELDRFVSCVVQSKAEYLQAQNVGMQYVTRTANKSVQTSPGVLIPSMVYSYTWHDIPALVDSADPLAEFKPPCVSVYTKMIGKTNTLAFDGHPPRTMVLIDVQSQIKMPKLQDGLYLYDLTYTFDVRNHGTPGVGSDPAKGVDYIYDLANSRWDLITTTGDTSGERLFQADDYTKLFNWGA